MLKFEDIRIIPNLSDIESRKDCNTISKLNDRFIEDYIFDLPLLVASMHSIVSLELLRNVEKAGAGVVQPRDMNLQARNMMWSTSIEKARETATKLVMLGGGVLSIEVANGYMKKLADKVSEIKNTFPDLFIMAGTVADYHGAKRLVDSGADAILLGIGVGEVCTTTDNTGVGLSAAESLMSVYNSGLNAKMILAGGVRSYGDFCKAIALGADFVMSGSLFKNCEETPTNGKVYWGEASLYEKYAENKDLKYIEGRYINNDELDIPIHGDEIIKKAKDALQSAMSYVGARNLKEYRGKVRFHGI